MAVRIYNSSWKDDLYLMQQWKEHNSKGMRLQEILSYMKRDFSQYSWSLITLNRRLRFFSIYRHDKNVTVDEVTEAIKKECKEPGQLLGYRAMNRVFVFPDPRPFAWPLAVALAPNLYLLALAPNLYLPAPAPNLYLPALASNLYLPTLAPTLFLPALAPNLYLRALAPTLCLPQICIYRLSPGLEFAYTDLVSPICIYWPWPTICTHTGC